MAIALVTLLGGALAPVALAVDPPGADVPDIRLDATSKVGTPPAFPAAAGTADEPTDGKAKVIVRFRTRPGAADVARLRSAGGEVLFRYQNIPSVAISVPEAAIAGLSRNPNVVSVERAGRITALDHVTTSGNLEYENAWGTDHIGTLAVHSAGITGAGVKVAVIDTGLDYIHYDPTANPPIYNEFNSAYAGGYDFVNGDQNPMDDNGHGTHVSGILAAELNGYLIAGVAPGVELYALKVLGPTGEGDYAGLIAALDWAISHDIDVVNMSLGGHEVSTDLQLAVEAAYEAGIVMVAASGNTVTFWELIFGCPVAYPAAYPQVLATTFTNPADELTGLSCTGPQVDFAAPGDGIYSTVPIGPTGSCMFCSPVGYSAQSGTSMASPHLAGLVALVLDHGIADTTPDGQLMPEIRAHLCDNTNPGGRIAQTDSRYPNWYGCGVIDADKALLLDPPDGGGGPPPNEPPVATDDSASTAEDTPTVIAVLGNDSDPDGGTLSVTGVTQPANGSTSTNGTTVTYAPPADWSGSTTFGYTIADGQGGTDSATVAVTVTAVNDPPVAVADNATTPYQTAVVISVLANDSDIDGGPLSVASVTSAAHGSVSTNGTTVTYTPAAGWSGPDTFSYTASDGAGGQASATVSVTTSAPPPASTVMHIGDLDGAASRQSRSWTAQVTALVADAQGGAVTGATVTGKWSGGAKGNGSCITGSDGRCTIAKSGIGLAKTSATFTVTGVSRSGWTYDAAANTDPDPPGPQASNGTAITVPRPA
jgi:subtilisin family serine protease